MINTDLGNLFSGTAEALWQIGKDKDSVAWSKIVKMHSAGMLNTAKGVLGDHFLAEDAVQNAFLQIRDLSAEYFRRENGENSIGVFSHQKDNTIFKNDFAARNWIIRITYFVAKDMKKSRVASKEREKVFTKNWIHERESRPVSDQEVLGILQAEIEKLPEDLRLPLVLRFHCDMNFNQIGLELGLAVHVIRKRVENGIEILKEKVSVILGSSMPAISVEGLLSNVFSLNASVSDSLSKNCIDLLDKPALLKSLLIPENKLLLQSSKFIVKGLVMLKILAIFVVLIGTASVVVNSISSNESKSISQDGQASLSTKEDSLKKGNSIDSEITKTDHGMGQTDNIINKLEGENAILSDAISEKASPIAETKKDDFNINEILPYFSDKAMVAIILPDLSGSFNRFSNSNMSKFYADPLVNFFGKFPLIVKSFLNIDAPQFTSDIVKILLEKAIDSFHCLGAQYSEDINAKTSSFFVVGLLKNEEVQKFELLLQSLKPFQIETKKNKKGFDVITYQFAKDQTKFELIKQQNKVFFGVAGGIWLNDLENNVISDSLNKKIFKSDIYWRSNVISLMEKQFSRPSESLPKIIDVLNKLLTMELAGNIEGEFFIQKTKILHKVFVPMKRAHQYAFSEVLVVKNITAEMLKQIPIDRKAFLCLNIDLQKSWANYNGFMEYFFNTAVTVGGEGYVGWKSDYTEELPKTEEICQALFQMSISMLMERCLSGEIVSWVAIEPLPVQTIKLGVKEPEYALKLIQGLEPIWGKDSGVKINLIGKYITIVMPVSKDLINTSHQKTPEEKLSGSLVESDILNKNFISWSDTNFTVNHSILFLFFNLFSQGQEEIGGDRLEDNDLLRIFLNAVKCSATSFVLTRTGLNLEFEGFDDFVQLLIGGGLLDKRHKVKNDSIAIYTEIKGNIIENGKPSEYIASKGNLLNGQKTGRWIFYNHKGVVTDEGEFKNNKEIGVWKKTDWMGNVGEGEMVDGLQTGQWKILHYQWKNPSYGEMKLGKKVGVWKAYHNKNNKLAEEGEYVDDKKVGTWVHFHNNGLKEFEEKYNVNGLLDGERITWDEQGNILSTETYKNGQLNGFKKNYVNQKLVSEEEAEDGHKLWSKNYFHENSNLKAEYRFDKVNAMEIFKEFYTNGQLKLSTQNIVFMKDGKREYKNPMPTGEWVAWYEKNVIKMSGAFDKTGTGKMKIFYENSEKCTEYNLVNGLLDGKAEGWYDNGNLFFTGGYRQSKLNGKWVVYYFNGNKKVEVEFKDGVISSDLKIWNKNGEIKEDLPFSLAEALVNKTKLREYESKLRVFYEFHFFYSFWDSEDIPHLMETIKRENSDSLNK